MFARRSGNLGGLVFRGEGPGAQSLGNPGLTHLAVRSHSLAVLLLLLLSWSAFRFGKSPVSYINHAIAREDM